MALTSLDEARLDAADATSLAPNSGKLDLRRVNPNTALRLAQISRTQGFQRVFDIVVVLATLPLTIPAMLIAALLVYVEDRGKVMFLQERVGRNGRVFKIFKLRTMSENRSGESFTSVGDPRITRIGRILRRYRIDELPQIFNILLGQMSICGPRPEVAGLVESYATKIQHYSLRHTVRPGLTGWAQVRQGYAAGVDAVSEKLQYDLYYVVNRSLWFDLRILVLTVRTLFKGEGAR